MANFMYIIRKRLKLSPDKSIYLFVNDTTLVPTAALMSTIYTENKDEDGFLYIKYASESTFWLIKNNILFDKKISNIFFINI